MCIENSFMKMVIVGWDERATNESMLFGCLTVGRGELGPNIYPIFGQS